ncbi:peptidoglycan D,D-transpeptidase FtsI family protein [Actinomadura madurae]|uniref:peptidoglycan D,D-transpeptidase FtsI family protein n=1 Tax=Actinomadura madurae TaxID=1993 RepID=UPI000D864E54|nr:penicillin-binding transpeptidase domain-containing protein [Actinomadura madurae]MCP9968886.1 penicillin-binding protein 2 [Actinomadura madurae]MCQ0007127.1 penicillin-binding protein 2 [Actinomadura madurae]MCQ0017565.1 penicillin-binding protein 2 [Actinomadura madurae]URM97662.1 penicillin-binding protein 2 [Actinomadura madurae]URN08347.1 penicillin-binding protein 2 [Actinomadura madurae]
MNMDKPVRRVAIFALLLFFGLMAQVNYVQGSQAEDLRTDARNSRQYADVFNSPRGQISAGGEVLVTSKETGKDNPKYGRTYKDGPIFAPVTGYFNGNATQVERAYNSLLGGKDKRITQQRWFDTFIGKKAEGANVELTIDPQAQRTAYQQLKAKTTQGRRGGAVVIDVETGAVKVAASWPSFDPNEVAPQTGEKGGQRLEQLDQGNGVVKPLVDNAMSQTFPPGSSFKAVVSAIGMQKLGLNSSSTVNTGQLILPESGRPLPNSHDTGNCAGTAPLRGAFAESCNTSFAKMALDLGIEQLHEGATKFGFGERIQLEPDMYAAESDVPVAYTDAEGKTTPTGKDGTARSGIGQENVRATPLQMALVACSIANDGKIMSPYVVQKVRAKDQSELYNASSKELGEGMTGDQAEQLQDMMRAVISEGTAKNLQGMRIAGKTGTAEQGPGNPNANWFVGFSPAENPRYAFAVMTEVAGGSGAGDAGPIAGAIMAKVLQK